MSHNKHNSNGCGCTSTTTKTNNCRCSEPTECACKVYISSDCVNTVKAEFPCLGVESGLPLTQTLEAMDSAICERINSTGESQLINIGGGAEVYKGINLLGQKQLKTIVSSNNSIEITSNDSMETIDLSIPNVTPYTIQNEGEGAKVFNEDTSTEFDFKLKTITSKDNSVNIEEEENTISLSVPIYSLENQGEGIKILDESNSTATDFKIKTISSETLTISEEVGGGLSINIPETSQIPALYVNNLYVPTYNEWVKAGGNLITNPTFQFKGAGTSSQPFTDSVNYTSASTRVITITTAIQNALDAYVGDTGTYSRSNPQLLGQQIVILNNSYGYEFNGDFNYSDLRLKIEGNVRCTLIGNAINMDNDLYFGALNASVTIEVSSGVTLEFTQSLGFHNSGNTNAVDDYTSAKQIRLIGDGRIYFSYSGADALTKYIFDGNGNNNSGNLHYEVRCKIEAVFQGVYFSREKNRIDFYNSITSGTFLGTVNTALKAFHMTGGQIRFFEEGAISISSGGSSRTYGITFMPSQLGLGYCIFQMDSSKIEYNCRYLFARLDEGAVNLIVRNTLGSGATTFPLGSATVIEGLFENTASSKWDVEFKNNNFTFTGIDFNKVDFTQGNTISSTNFIGNNIIESLVVYDSASSASLNSIPKGSVFLKRVTVNAGSFVVGQEYRIATITGTSFTLVGASANTVGLYFTATSAGTTQGTAYLESRQVLQ